MADRLTWTCIIGDAHVGVLARMLKSLVERPGGPSCSEIVIGWNGKDDAAFAAALKEVLPKSAPSMDADPDYAYVDLYTDEAGRECTVRFFRQQWTGNFGQARNETLARASMEWVGYIDGDDTLLLPSDPRVRESLDDEPIATVAPVPLVGTLESILDRLPKHINVVKCPYHYVLAPNGKPLLRKRRPRFVRRDPYWTWVNEVHEVYRHALDREIACWLPGTVLAHDPPQTQRERGERNFKILETQLASLPDGKPVSSMQGYGLACQAFDNGRLMDAVTFFQEAADRSGDHEERLLNVSMASRTLLELGRYMEAGEKALKAIECAPERPEGYLLASEAEFRLRRYPRCVQWYEVGGKLPLPNAAMIDDRVERCMRPVRYAGVAYARLGQPEKAIEVAEIALGISPEPFAERLVESCRVELRRQKIERRVQETADLLIKGGFPLAAKRVARATSNVLFGGKVEDTINTRVSEALARELTGIDPESSAGKWLAALDVKDSTLGVPLDGLDDPQEALQELAKNALPGYGLAFCVTDPQRGDDYALSLRADSIPAPQVLRLAESIGKVEELSLLDGFLACRVVPSSTLERWEPDFTFWCPRFMEAWGPWRLLRDGTGGSEESVVYLANELAARGYNVQVFAPLDVALHRGAHVQQGVRWFPLEAFDPIKPIPGISISCRAPDAIGLPCFDLERLYIWHQDAGYNVGWTPARAQAVRGLFVSKWQRQSLLKQVGLEAENADALTDRFGVVCGDGIPASALEWGSAERDPYACAYISSPLRGLGPLLEAWPTILSAIPEAKLHVFYGWETAPPELRALREKLMLDVRKGGPSVIWRGRIPQRELEQELPKFGVLLYPCHFPEGYMIAGVRATAAGLVPVYRAVGALPEIQYPSPFAVPETAWQFGGQAEFIEAAVAGLKASVDGSYDREAAREWARGKTWDTVADALLADVLRRGLLTPSGRAIG